MFKLDSAYEDFAVECANSILPPDKGLVDASGGVLVSPDEQYAVVVCGGEFVLDNSNGNNPNYECMVLNDIPVKLSANGFLNAKRIGSASMIIDNGNTLWVTGGADSHSTTEFVTAMNVEDSFWTNNAGPILPNSQLEYHCLTKLGPEVAAMIGGKSGWLKLNWSIYIYMILGAYLENNDGSTSWSVNLSTMKWKPLLALNKERHKHACGVFKMGNTRLIVAAGGSSIDNNDILDSVEFLEATETGDVPLGGQFEFGPSMPMPIRDGASAMTSDQLALFVVGGTSINVNVESLFKLRCSDVQDVGKCSWSKVGIELRLPTTRGLAIMMPPISIMSRQYPNARECSGIDKKS